MSEKNLLSKISAVEFHLVRNGNWIQLDLVEDRYLRLTKSNSWDIFEKGLKIWFNFRIFFCQIFSQNFLKFTKFSISLKFFSRKFFFKSFSETNLQKWNKSREARHFLPFFWKKTSIQMVEFLLSRNWQLYSKYFFKMKKNSLFLKE